MKKFNPSFRSKVTGMAASLALLFVTPQWAIAQTGSTAYGTNALSANTGTDNSAFGENALRLNTTGSGNDAFGSSALKSNTLGGANAAFGALSLSQNTTGTNNVAVGLSALQFNTTGSENLAAGVSALQLNVDGFENTALGEHTLAANLGGYENTGTGFNALRMNTTGYENTGNGVYSIFSNVSGWGNTAVGYQALFDNKLGHNNLALGYKAGQSITGSNNIAILNSGVAGENNTTRIGAGQSRAFIAGISGVKVAGGVQVFINTSGQLGTLTSSERFKQDIKTINTASEKLQQLRPVSFLYKDSAESGEHTLQYGLIAEEVAKVYPELVQYDSEGKPFTVYYHLLTPLLLSEVQKEYKRNAEQETTLAAQQVALSAQQKKLDAQQTELANLNQHLASQHEEMTALLQQQKQQLAEMAALQQKLNQLDNLVQASHSNQHSDEKLAMVTNH